MTQNLIIRMTGVYLNTLSFLAPAKAADLGFRLFCRPFRTPINEKQKHFFNTADRSIFEHEGLKIQTYKWGRGPRKILFLHGWQSHTYRWKAYIDGLSQEEYTIYSLDAPGHGQSTGNFLSVPVYSNLIQKFIQELGAIDTVIGHSLGSFSILYNFYQNPLIPVRKVILLAPPGEATDFMNFYREKLKLTDRTLSLVIDRFVKEYDVTPDFFSTAKFAASVNTHGLIIHDEEDIEAPYRYAVDIHKAWRKSTLLTTKGLGHNLKASSVVNEVVSYINNETPVLKEKVF